MLALLQTAMPHVALEGRHKKEVLKLCSQSHNERLRIIELFCLIHRHLGKLGYISHRGGFLSRGKKGCPIQVGDASEPTKLTA